MNIIKSLSGPEHLLFAIRLLNALSVVILASICLSAEDIFRIALSRAVVLGDEQEVISRCNALEGKMHRERYFSVLYDCIARSTCQELLPRSVLRQIQLVFAGHARRREDSTRDSGQPLSTGAAVCEAVARDQLKPNRVRQVWFHPARWAEFAGFNSLFVALVSFRALVARVGGLRMVRIFIQGAAASAAQLGSSESYRRSVASLCLQKEVC